MRCWRGPKSLKRGRRWAACIQHYAVTTTRILHLDGQGSRPLPFHYNCRGQGHFYNLNLAKMKIHQHTHLCLNSSSFCTKAEISPLTFLFSTFYQPSESYTLICNGGREGGWGINIYSIQSGEEKQNLWKHALSIHTHVLTKQTHHNLLSHWSPSLWLNKQHYVNGAAGTPSNSLSRQRKDSHTFPLGNLTQTNSLHSSLKLHKKFQLINWWSCSAISKWPNLRSTRAQQIPLLPANTCENDVMHIA